jgi:hypothetical protein
MTTDTGQYQEYDWNDQGSDNGFTPDDDPDYASLFDAPDYAKLIRGGTQTTVSKEYADKIRSLLKAGVLGTLRSGNIPDAATLLHYGPEFASATGELAASSERTRKLIDLITAPDAPVLLFTVVAVSMVFQLARNHEKELSAASMTRREQRTARKQARKDGTPKPPARGITIKLPFGKSFTIGVRFRFPIAKALAASIRAQTHDPADLATKVFSDPKLIAELRKQGIPVVIRRG